jgi:hypothetical protein
LEGNSKWSQGRPRSSLRHLSISLGMEKNGGIFDEGKDTFKEEHKLIGFL